MSLKVTIFQITILDEKVKLSVVIYLKNMIKRKVDKSELPKEPALEILKFYSEFLTNSQVANKLHENIKATIISILNYPVIAQDGINPK